MGALVGACSAIVIAGKVWDRRQMLGPNEAARGDAHARQLHFGGDLSRL